MFGFVGTMPIPRAPLWEVAFQLSNFAPGLGLQLVYVVVFQIGKEEYPTNLASTGTSVILGINRLGCIFLPLLFENIRDAVGRWDVWFYGTACWALFCALVA